MKVSIFLILLLNSIYAQNNTWVRTNGLHNEYINALAINSDGHIFAGTFLGNIYRSQDNGNNWTFLVDLAIPWSLAINDSQHVFAATGGGEGIYRSKDNGGTWQAANNGLHHNTCNNLAFGDSGYVFAATDYGIYRSSDNGDNWMPIDSGLPATLMYDVCVSPTGYVFVGTYDMGIYRSDNQGLSWHEKNNGLTRLGIYSLISNKSGHIFSGPDYGTVERSTDNGENWTNLNNFLPAGGGYHVFTINSEGTKFVGHEIIYGVYRSVDNGDTWTEFNSGLTNKNIHSLAINNEEYIFAGTSDGVFRTEQTTTSFNFNHLDIPGSINLEQNYPNPFNPITIIKFRIPSSDKFILNIYDIRGKKIDTLINKKLKAGDYELNFNAGKLSSGLYYYTLISGKTRITKKMIILK